jgi:hypothetical protein
MGPVRKGGSLGGEGVCPPKLCPVLLPEIAPPVRLRFSAVAEFLAPQRCAPRALGGLLLELFLMGSRLNDERAAKAGVAESRLRSRLGGDANATGLLVQGRASVGGTRRRPLAKSPDPAVNSRGAALTDPPTTSRSCPPDHSTSAEGASHIGRGPCYPSPTCPPIRCFTFPRSATSTV